MLLGCRDEVRIARLDVVVIVQDFLKLLLLFSLDYELGLECRSSLIDFLLRNYFILGAH